MIPLSEQRALREFYSRKAIAALARRFPAGGIGGWTEILHNAARQPWGPQADALRLYLGLLSDVSDWAAVDRFLFHADGVWEQESEAMMDLQPYARRQVA